MVSILKIQLMLRWAVVFFCLISCVANAQRGRDLGWVKGTVKDAATQEPLPFAVIEVFSGSSADTSITDYDGFFVIRTPKRPLSIRVLQEGYLAYRKEVDPTEHMVILDIGLERMDRKP